MLTVLENQYQKKNLSIVLKSLRKSQNLSQYDMARLINRSQGSYSDIENGKTMPDIDTLNILADHFNCSIDYLVGRENEDCIINIQGIQLNTEEERLINKFRQLSPDEKKAIITIIDAMK